MRGWPDLDTNDSLKWNTRYIWSSNATSFYIIQNQQQTSQRQNRKCNNKRERKSMFLVTKFLFCPVFSFTFEEKVNKLIVFSLSRYTLHHPKLLFQQPYLRYLCYSFLTCFSFSVQICWVLRLTTCAHTFTLLQMNCLLLFLFTSLSFIVSSLEPTRTTQGVTVIFSVWTSHTF